MARTRASSRLAKSEVPIARNPASSRQEKFEVPMARNPASFTNNVSTAPESRPGRRKKPASSRLEDDISPVITPKEPVENIRPPVKASKSSKGKQKTNGEESKTTTGVPLKKVKTENQAKDDVPIARNPAPSRLAKSEVPIARNPASSRQVKVEVPMARNPASFMNTTAAPESSRPGRRRNPSSSRLEDDLSPVKKAAPVENTCPVKASKSSKGKRKRNGEESKTENKNGALARATTAPESRPGRRRNPVSSRSNEDVPATESRPIRKKRHTDWMGDDLFKSKLAVQPLHPYFVTVAKQCRENELYVPKEMLRKYRLDLPQNIQLVDERGMHFWMHLKEWTDGRKFYANGWKVFCGLNGVKVDDKVICEFTQGRGGKLYLHGRVVRTNWDNIF